MRKYKHPIRDLIVFVISTAIVIALCVERFDHPEGLSVGMIILGLVATLTSATKLFDLTEHFRSKFL